MTDSVGVFLGLLVTNVSSVQLALAVTRVR